MPRNPVYLENHTGGSNKYYLMFQLDSDTLRTIHGPIGGHATIHDYPIGDWSKKYDEKMKKQYKVTTMPAHITGVDMNQVRGGATAPTTATPTKPKPIVAPSAPVKKNPEHLKKLDIVVNAVTNSKMSVDTFDVNSVMDIKRRFERTGILTVNDMKELNRLYTTYK